MRDIFPIFFKDYKKWAAFSLMFLFLSGCVATAPKTTSPASTNNLKDLCQQYNIQWRWDSVSQVVTLEKNGVKAKVLVGSRNVFFGETKIVLDEAVKFKRSSIIVSEDFKGKVLDMFVTTTSSIKTASFALRKIKRIVVDAGHGGKDPGAIGRMGLYEKKVVLDLCKRLKSILNHYGFDVVMTRTKDEFIALKDRTEIASQKEGDLFVSIHANSHASPGIYGLEVYASNNLDLTERNEEQRKFNEEILFNKMNIKKNTPAIGQIVSDMLYVHKEAESASLSALMAQATAEAVNTKNLGTKRARFFVLRNTIMPAILIEVGFLSNPKEERNLDSGAYRQKLASAIAKNIVKYANE